MWMARPVTVSEQVLLPVAVEDASAFLSDTARMVTLDPLLVAYEPERGVIEEGTLNRVTMRLGPLRLTSTSRTEVLDPPQRVVFVSVHPKRLGHASVTLTLDVYAHVLPAMDDEAVARVAAHVHGPAW